MLDIRSGVYDSPFIAVHHDPHPCVNEGIWLGNQPEVHAMMDISDGLASDLSHILEESETGAEISIERIPTRTTVELAVTGGEDYQLLLTVGPKPPTGLRRSTSGISGSRCTGSVGYDPELGYNLVGQREVVRPQWKGFRHFDRSPVPRDVLGVGGRLYLIRDGRTFRVREWEDLEKFRLHFGR